MKKLKLSFKGWTIIIVPVLLSFLLYQKKQVTVYLIGDSTMCLFGPAQSPLTGWGMPFANFFDSSVTVKDKAESGSSTRTFIEENLWKPVEDSLKPGDYLLIQFGHNDEVSTKESYTTEKDFKTNLIRFITAARNKRANPVLITPVARRNFDDNGNIQETHEPYSTFVRNVALEYKVPLIDLNKKSQHLLQELGPEKSKFLFNHLAPGENPHFPKGAEDNTHFNELGARKIAEMVLAEIKTLKLELADRIVKPRH
ncbi:MAG: rhamnogalacturonan acetylesterase [Bacteroidota bacterium]|nr:rhamnogalacturonan acetylesterase [Bacteroidota bacterium]